MEEWKGSLSESRPTGGDGRTRKKRARIESSPTGTGNIKIYVSFLEFFRLYLY